MTAGTTASCSLALGFDSFTAHHFPPTSKFSTPTIKREIPPPATCLRVRSTRTRSKTEDGCFCERAVAGLARRSNAHNQAGNPSSSNLPTRARYADREENGQWLPLERAIPASHAVPTPTIKREISPPRFVELPRGTPTGRKTEQGRLQFGPMALPRLSTPTIKREIPPPATCLRVRDTRTGRKKANGCLAKEPFRPRTPFQLPQSSGKSLLLDRLNSHAVGGPGVKRKMAV